MFSFLSLRGVPTPSGVGRRSNLGSKYKKTDCFRQDGFTLIELMIVLTLIAILLSIAVPTYQNSVIKAREAALLENLHMMRDAIDKYYSDTGKYPGGISELVEKKYLRSTPVDPFTGSAETWEEKPPDDGSGVYDVASGSDVTGRNGVPYNEW